MINFIKTMAPGWFAGVMGTSVASLAAWLLFAATPWQWGGGPTRCTTSRS